MRKAGIAVLALLAGSLAAYGWARAAEGDREGVGISPTAIFVEADSGQTKSGVITVMNEGTAPADIRLYASSFKVRNEDYEKDFDLPSTAGFISPANWFSLEAATAHLQPQEQRKINYTLKVPAGVAGGGYYGVIFAETKASKADATGVVRIKRVGALAYLTVAGDLIKKGSLESFKTDFWQQQRPIKSELRIANQGNVHFRAEGRLRLRNLFGGKVSEVSVGGVIVPGTTRRFTPELPTGQGLGIYRVEGEISYLDQQEVLGSKWVLLASPAWLGLLVGSLVVIIWIVTSPKGPRRPRTKGPAKPSKK